MKKTDLFIKWVNDQIYAQKPGFALFGVDILAKTFNLGQITINRLLKMNVK